MIKGICPNCGYQLDVVAAMDDVDGRRLMALMAELPQSVARLLYPYLNLFSPKKTSLRYARMVKLVQELAPMIKAAQVTRNGTTYAVPLPLWADTLEHLATRPKTLTLPLKSHGYLLEILAGKAEKVAGKKEAQQIEQQRHRSRSSNQTGPVSITNSPEYQKYRETADKIKGEQKP